MLDRDENIHLLKIDLDEKKHQLEEFHSSSLKQQQQLSDLLQTKTNENQTLIETNRQLKDDLKENNELLFEKSKQADDLDKQLQVINNEYRELTAKFNQINSLTAETTEVKRRSFSRRNDRLSIDFGRLSIV